MQIVHTPNLAAFLAVRRLILQINDPQRAHDGYGAGNFEFRDQSDVNIAKDLILRHIGVKV